MAEAGAAAGERVRADPGGAAVRSPRTGSLRAGSAACVTGRFSIDLRSSLRSSGVRTWPARPTKSAMWYATTLMSQSGVACTPSSEPSLIDMTKTLPSSIATIVCLTPPPSISFAAPMVRLPMPETIVARSALEPLRAVRSARSWPPRRAARPGSEESSSRPSEETTATERTPGTSSTRLLSSQCRLRASLLRPP